MRALKVCCRECLLMLPECKMSRKGVHHQLHWLVSLLDEEADDPLEPLLKQRDPDPLEAVDGQVGAGARLLQRPSPAQERVIAQKGRKLPHPRKNVLPGESGHRVSRGVRPPAPACLFHLSHLFDNGVRVRVLLGDLLHQRSRSRRLEQSKGATSES